MKLGIVGAGLDAVCWRCGSDDKLGVYARSLRNGGEREVDEELASDVLLVTYAIQRAQIPEETLAELPRPGLSWLVVRDGRLSRARLTSDVQRDRLTVETRCITATATQDRI